MAQTDDDVREPCNKVVTLRLTAKDAKRVAFVARVEEVSTNELFKRAFEAYLDVLRTDPTFSDRVQAQLAVENEIAKQLA